MSIIQINSIEGIPANASYDDLEFGHYTGQAILLSGSGRDKKYSYRHGVATNLPNSTELIVNKVHHQLRCFRTNFWELLHLMEMQRPLKVLWKV